MKKAISFDHLVYLLEKNSFTKFTCLVLKKVLKQKKIVFELNNSYFFKVNVFLKINYKLVYSFLF